MVNLYIDNLGTKQARALFNHFSDNMDYIVSAECNLNGPGSSVRLEAHSKYDFFCDLAEYFQNESR